MLNIKNIRIKKNISVKELAEKSGVSERMLHDYESGKRDIMLSKLKNIADVLNVSVLDLLDVADKLQIVSEPTPLYGKVKHQDQEGKDAIIKMQKELIESYKKQIELLLENLDRVNAQNIG